MQPDVAQVGHHGRQRAARPRVQVQSAATHREVDVVGAARVQGERLRGTGEGQVGQAGQDDTQGGLGDGWSNGTDAETYV